MSEADDDEDDVDEKDEVGEGGHGTIRATRECGSEDISRGSSDADEE